jgi:RNase P/RNase MRP subunit p30
MKISLNTPVTLNLEKIQQIRSIIEKNIDVDHSNIKNLEPEELYDYQKILQICEFILVKHENKKSLQKNLKKFINVINSTIISLESLDEEINELSISADLSINTLSEFKANLLQSKEDHYDKNTQNLII